MDLAGELLGLGRGVVVGNPDQHEQTIGNRADHLAIDRDAGPADRLDKCTHPATIAVPASEAVNGVSRVRRERR